MTKSVEYFASTFNYVSKCPEVEESSVEDESREDAETNSVTEEEEADDENDLGGEVHVEEVEQGEEVDGGDGGMDEEEEELLEEILNGSEVEGSEAQFSSMAVYESSLPQYDSASYSESNVVADYISSFNGNYGEELQSESELFDDYSTVNEADYGYESSVEALINYLAQYWDEALEDRGSLTGTGWWPQQDIPIGQIAGLDVDSRGNLVLFRRGERSWKPK